MIVIKTIYHVFFWTLRVIRDIIMQYPIKTLKFISTIKKDDYYVLKNILLQSNLWVEGPHINEFEKELAKFIGTERAFSFLGGRVALSALLETFGIDEGDEVILPAYTCVVVPNAIRYRKAIPVYVDIELDTLGPDKEEVLKLITPKTKAIIVHHLFGIVCRDFDDLLKLGKDKNILIIEDCAHALGTEYKGKKVGTFGDGAFFSFEQSKVITTRMGGIAIAKNPNFSQRLAEIQKKHLFPDKEIIKKLLKETFWSYWLYNDSKSWFLFPWLSDFVKKYSIPSTTIQEINGIKPDNYGQRLPNALAMLGINQLAKIERINQERREMAKHWEEWALMNSYKPLMVIPFSKPIYLRYPLLVEPEKKGNLNWARKMGVKPGVWFVSMEHPRNIVCPYKNASLAIRQNINFPTFGRKK